MRLEKVGNKYLKIDGVQIKMKEPYKYAEAYIEEGFYETAKMEQKGIQYDLLGIFNMRFFKDDTGKDPSPLLVFNFPTRIMIQPTAQEKRTMVLNPAEGEKTYIILKYYSEDLIIINRNVVSKFVNTEQFFKIFTGGKFPTCVPYDAVLPMMLDNMAINKQKNLDSSPLIFSFIVGESIRAKKDKSKPFRMIYGKTDNPFAWIGASARSIAENNSTFTAITFEDPNQMLQASIARARSGKEEDDVESPLEDTIKY